MSNVVESGECFEFVLSAIERDISQRAAEHVRACAREVVTNCVGAYEHAFGAGDVGRGASGQVGSRFEPSDEGPVAPDTNGLLYGRVQSGKTNVSIATVGLGHANGFRCFVVLTSDNTWLGLQTATRFRDQLSHGGPVVMHWEEWSRDPRGVGNALRSYVDDTGVVLISTKNVHHLENLIEVLQAAKCDRVPAIVLDDEADNASLNTNASRQARQGPDAIDPSAVFSLIGDIRAEIPNHVFLQVTATPQSLLLQGLDNPLRPAFCVIAPPGEDYVGGEVFFSEGSLHVVEVDHHELNDLRSLRVNPGNAWAMPEGLGLAVCCFVCASAFQEIRAGAPGNAVYSMLVHIDHRKVSHEFVGQTIREFLSEFDQALRGRLSASRQEEAGRMLEKAFRELERTERELPPLPELRTWIEMRLRNASPQIINADNPQREPNYRPGMNVLIGGNRLGRGVTIRGLMVTYYGRDPRTQMMDTVHQHARMFGYRRPLLSVTRVFSAAHLLNSFRAIHESDTGMREAIGDESATLRVKPVWVGPNLRPTRANVLNPADIGAMVGGRQIWPPHLRTRKVDVSENVTRLDELLSTFTDEREYYEVPIDRVVEILELIPSDPDPAYSWEDARVIEVLRAIQVEPVEIFTGRLNVHRGRNGEGLEATRPVSSASGFIAGPQQQEVRRRFPRQPTLILHREKGRRDDGWDNQPFWAPTLILPQVGFVFMFSFA